MGKEYVITDVKKRTGEGATWHNGYGEYQKYGVVLEGIGEPVRMDKLMPVNQEPQKGDTIYGTLTEEKVGDGRMYYKFKSEKRPPDATRERSIETQWAIRLATEVYLSGDYDKGSDRKAAYENIETEARHFLQILVRIKGE
jgi:hypothetical protein